MGAGINTQQPVIHALHRKILWSEQPTGTPTSWTVPLGTIPKNSFKTNTRAHLVTAFAGATTPSLMLGVTGAVSLFMTSAEIMLLTVNNTLAAGTTGLGLVSADAPVIATFASLGTALTAGEIRVVIEFMPPVMNKEADTLFDGNN